MALKPIYDTQDEVPEAFRGEYVERNGKFELQVEGMKTQADVDRVTEALRKSKDDYKTLSGRVALLGDSKIEDVITQLDRIHELEAAAAGGIDEKKMNELVEGRIKSRLAPVERERDTFKTKVGELEGQVGEFTAKERTRAIHDAVRKAATASKVLPEALEDALMLAERQFEVTEDGKIVTKDGVNGLTAGLGAEVWFTDLQKTRSHWWGPSAGGGAGGNRNGGGMDKNPWSGEHWNMTEQGKIYAADKDKATQLAKAAGHANPLGAMRPAPKK